MKIKITFENYDPYLASMIRGLVAQIEGFGKVKGQRNVQILINDYLEFDLNDEAQCKRCEKAIRKYIAAQFQNGLKIEIISN